MIPVQTFIERVIQDYEDLWGNQNVEQMMESFAYKVTDIFGVEGVDAR